MSSFFVTFRPVQSFSFFLFCFYDLRSITSDPYVDARSTTCNSKDNSITHCIFFAVEPKFKSLISTMFLLICSHMEIQSDIDSFLGSKNLQTARSPPRARPSGKVTKRWLWTQDSKKEFSFTMELFHNGSSHQDCFFGERCWANNMKRIALYCCISTNLSKPIVSPRQSSSWHTNHVNHSFIWSFVSGEQWL